ncbi:response regulator transcription factor [Cohnella phaseoli]|uniref:YesN/AraC family two-component response regulator n=1 Tax=Cohnella phaseoli TaxID=456490 RepID=A0A3D9JS60_9BACL|nr:response regulator [Cohnella phaseoli]RED76878.1 YesN/AraC family two-component response regulator [Cohnella phaseoli]
MKKKVIVIDDKPIIVRSIVQTLDWDRLGCEVVGHAEDGIEGERLIQNVRPDILITDIRMPGHDGLYLSEFMRTYLPQSKTIIITGYQEFEYAQRAIRLGAFDFIVKPIRNDELYKIVEAAVREIDAVRSEKLAVEQLGREYNDLEQRHNSSLPALRSQWMTALIRGTAMDEEGFLAKQKELGIHYSRFALIALKPLQSGVQERDPANVAYRERIVDTVLSASVKYELQVIPAYWNDIVLFVCLFSRIPTTREARMKLKSLASDWLERIQRLNGVRSHIAVGMLRKSLKELEEAYSEVRGLIDSGFFLDDDHILLRDSGSESRATGKFSIMQDLEQFNRVLEQSTAEEVIRYLERFVDQIRVYSEGNILVVKGLLSEVCIATARYYFRLTGDEFGLGKSIDQVLDDVFRLNSLKEASDYLADWVGVVKRKVVVGDKEYSLMVRKVIDYINTHFSETINLTSVAEHFGISHSYLSRLLRTETGINFVDLVSKARIEAAKRLLRDPKYKVNEVGELVGYKEYAYFYQVFKRIEGRSPKEYKNAVKEN